MHVPAAEAKILNACSSGYIIFSEFNKLNKIFYLIISS